MSFTHPMCTLGARSCLSVNDPFVMAAWQREQHAESITFLPDGDGSFTAAMGMLVDKSAAGLGKRSWRYSMFVNDGRERAKAMLTGRGIPFEVIHIGDGVTMSSVRAASGAAKVPQVFIEGKLIGGSDALKVFLDKSTRETRVA